MDGSWTVVSAITREASQYITGDYSGRAIATVRPCGENRALGDAVIMLRCHRPSSTTIP
jgi:hypothetical protein